VGLGVEWGPAGPPPSRRSGRAPIDTGRRIFEPRHKWARSTVWWALAEDAELIGDGGGKVPSFGKAMVGGPRIAQLYLATHLRFKQALRIELAVINGQWGVLRFIDGQLESAQSFETDGQRIVRIHVQRNPDKLARIAAALGWTRPTCAEAGQHGGGRHRAAYAPTR
jgi:hypothetical protein